ncbi:hypothetical protein VTN96DRAFT_4340 [Rasamsonia emersonii]
MSLQPRPFPCLVADGSHGTRRSLAACARSAVCPLSNALHLLPEHLPSQEIAVFQYPSSTLSAHHSSPAIRVAEPVWITQIWFPETKQRRAVKAGSLSIRFVSTRQQARTLLRQTFSVSNTG